MGSGSRCKTPYSKDRLLLDFLTFHFRLIRRTAYEECGGISLEADTVWDYDLCLRLSELAPVLHLPRPLYHYRVPPGSISVERQMDNIVKTEQIIRWAMARRGLDEEYNLSVQVQARFGLQKKPR